MTCRVIEINSNQVRIGIDAPRNIDVHREEIWLRINQTEKVN
ncbi:MAG: carbon storage regulator [Thalassotalea sp.]|nr:carbon storage regulator [Thalassotalea sp.]